VRATPVAYMYGVERACCCRRILWLFGPVGSLHVQALRMHYYNNIDSFLSSNLISTGISLKNVLKSFSSASTEYVTGGPSKRRARARGSHYVGRQRVAGGSPGA
jgi:hypothetical protein